MKTCRLAIVRASAGGGADVGGEDTDGEAALCGPRPEQEASVPAQELQFR